VCRECVVYVSGTQLFVFFDQGRGGQGEL
jgi:hypothetical protein